VQPCIIGPAYVLCYLAKLTGARPGAQAYSFTAAPEQLRQSREVKVGLVQNAIVAPTTAPFAEQSRVRRSPLLRRAGAGALC